MDDDITTTCWACGVSQSLNGATYNESETLDVSYSCQVCAATILIVCAAGDVVDWEGRGYHLGEWVVRNPSELVVFQRERGLTRRIPTSPLALD